MKISKKLLSLALTVILAVSMMIIAPISSSAASTVRINEVYPQVGYHIVYDIYLQTTQEAGTVEGRLNYDPKVLSLEKLSFDTANSFTSTTSTVKDKDGVETSRIEFTGTKSTYDCVSARMTVLEAVFEVVATSDKYTSATDADAVSGCFTNLSATNGYDLMKDENTNITTRTVIAPTSVSMTKSSVLLDGGVGDYEKVAVKSVGPVNNDVDSSFACTYTSSNPKVVKVSNRSTVVTIKAVGVGTATVTCMTDGGLAKTTIKVTVKQPVKKVALSKKSLTVKKGKSVSVKATVSPSNSSNKKMKVVSSNKKVAKVSASSVNSGKSFKVKGVKKGNATVTVTATDGSKKSAKCKVKVK